MSFSSIVMSYQENCKVEGEVMTKFKIARMFFAGGKKQIEISKYLKCHKNTICQFLEILYYYLANYLERFLIKFDVNFFGDFRFILV